MILPAGDAGLQDGHPSARRAKELGYVGVGVRGTGLRASAVGVGVGLPALPHSATAYPAQPANFRAQSRQPKSFPYEDSFFLARVIHNSTGDQIVFPLVEYTYARSDLDPRLRLPP